MGIFGTRGRSRAHAGLGIAAGHEGRTGRRGRAIGGRWLAVAAWHAGIAWGIEPCRQPAARPGAGACPARTRPRTSARAGRWSRPPAHSPTGDRGGTAGSSGPQSAPRPAVAPPAGAGSLPLVGVAGPSPLPDPLPDPLGDPLPDPFELALGSWPPRRITSRSSDGIAGGEQDAVVVPEVVPRWVGAAAGYPTRLSRPVTMSS